jgi:hypothetical protein
MVSPQAQPKRVSLMQRGNTSVANNVQHSICAKILPRMPTWTDAPISTVLPQGGVHSPSYIPFYMSPPTGRTCKRL